MTEELKIFVTGKGGVGKTTISAVLALLFAQKGYKILAIDEDSQINLPFSLGIKDVNKIIPLSQQFDYIEEKTGVRPGQGWGSMLCLNPDVSDVIEKFAIKASNNINILVMGTVKRTSNGCLCPEHTILNAVIRQICLRQDEVIIMDTQAGLEHFGRAIAKGFKYGIVVSEPSFNSIYVAKQAIRLAKDLSIPNIFLIVNKIRNDEIEKMHNLESELINSVKKVFFLPYDEHLIQYEPDLVGIVNSGSLLINAIKKVFEDMFFHPV